MTDDNKPWEDEGCDLVIWEAHSLLCHMRRHPLMGHWCGYVHLHHGHPWHGKGYDSIHDDCPDLSVHGGLTYADDGDMGDWVIGFDCGHAGDYIPGLERYRGAEDSAGPEPYEVYRTKAWVREETERLAAQAWDAVVRELQKVNISIYALLATKH